MLSERYRPRSWSDFVGQPVIDEIRDACADPWLFDGCGERWLFESDGLAGCGKTSAAHVAAQALGCSAFATEQLDSRTITVPDLRRVPLHAANYGPDAGGRRAFILDEIHHLNVNCCRMLLGILEQLPSHVIIIATTTEPHWADEVVGLASRWRRFRFAQPSIGAARQLLIRIAEKEGLCIPDDFVVPLDNRNLRELIDQLPTLIRKAKKADPQWASFKIA